MNKHIYIVKILLTLSMLLSSIFGADVTSIQFSGVDVTYKDKEIFVKRLLDPKCKKVAITHTNIFSEELANSTVYKECKKSFVTSVGTTQPIKIDDKIETVGEIEILNFLAILEFEPEKYALVDARNPQWYNAMTIPNSINIPFADIKDGEELSKKYDIALQLLSIEKDKNGKLIFLKAKKIIVFCNANWCVQSVWFIKSLINIGYPKDKISWYRGGLQDWLAAGFTTIEP